MIYYSKQFNWQLPGLQIRYSHTFMIYFQPYNIQFNLLIQFTWDYCPTSVALVSPAAGSKQTGRIPFEIIDNLQKAYQLKSIISNRAYVEITQLR